MEYAAQPECLVKLITLLRPTIASFRIYYSILIQAYMIHAGINKQT